MTDFVQPQDQAFLNAAYFQARINQAAPAAAADVVFQPTAGTANRYQILALSATLTTDVNVADRRVRWEIARVGGAVFITAFAPAVQVASTAILYTVSTYPVTEAGIVTGTMQIAMPYLPLISSGDRLALRAENMQAGDQWSIMSMLAMAVEE